MEIVREKTYTKKKRKEKQNPSKAVEAPENVSIVQGFCEVQTFQEHSSTSNDIIATVVDKNEVDKGKEIKENCDKIDNDKTEPVADGHWESTTIFTSETEQNVVIDNKVHADKFEQLINSSKELAGAIKLTELKEIETISAQVGAKVSSAAIKPYTESQLAALYHNTELEYLEDFVKQYVEAELKGLAIKQHPLYELLLTYLRVKEKLTGNSLELDQIRKECKSLQSELWTIETATVSARGECQDGNFVSASHSYNKSIFHRSVFQSIVRQLGNIQKIVYENHTLYAYSSEELRLQIEFYLQTVIANCLNVTQLNKNAPVALIVQSEPVYLKPYLCELRICISILFAFQRKLIRETQFVKETRAWLSQLVAVLLRLASYQDHLFILNHVLRCPAGISSWASCFVQTPLLVNLTDSPFANFQINHVLTVLSNILSPIKSREQFLEDIAQVLDMANEALWVMVDSDGEEDEESGVTSLKENDLVMLMNQLPLDNLFRNMLLVKERNVQDSIDTSIITEQHVLRYFAFSTVLLKILHKGLQTYGQPRYNQFSKRLSRFIRHIAQYATDLWEIFLKNQTIEDKAMLSRLQVEYDSFFLRTVFYLYSSQKLGAWQFLAVIPYNMITTRTLWKIFYFLHSFDNQADAILNPLDDEDYSKRIWEKEVRIQFDEKLSGLEDAEIYYLLNTFANMALARSETDMDFIYSATIDMLKIGYIEEETQESCSKSTRILLTHLTSKYPHLLSNILKEVKENMDKIGYLALHLYEELPLTIWNFSDNDLEQISRLLLGHPMTSNENKLARMILSRLNWNDISYEIHCEVAILVVAATLQEPGIENWAWQTILRLRLHINDKGFKEIGRVQELETYDVLQKGIRGHIPVAIFVSVLMTTWGHLVPLICTKGLVQLLNLQALQKHEAVLFALYQIIPLFINCQECLINCEKFQDVLVNLLNADRGYISMAKSLVYSQNTTILQQFGNMIETQIVNYSYYDLESPRCLVRLWINSLVSISGWHKDMSIMYLLNVIIRTSFLHSDAIGVVYDVLREQQQNGSPQESSGTIGSIFKWVLSGSANGSLISSSLSNYTWLAYVMINLEYEEREHRTGLWNEILVQLSKQTGKINVDQAIKKAAGVLKLSSFTSSYLCIYRWAQQAMDTPLDHPLLPLLWQIFFSLYLARINTPSTVERCCVGDKFFDGLVNFAFLKRIKRRLQESVDYLQSKLDLKDEDNYELDKKEFYKNSHKVFRAFLLWLEEPRLQENNVMLKNFPPQYESRLLVLIMQGNMSPWYEYLDYSKVKTEQQHCIKMWRIANFREKTNVNKPLMNAGSRVESDDPVERILRRLASYDNPKAAPEIVLSAPVIPKIQFGTMEEMLKFLEPCFKTLKQFAHNYQLKLAEQKSLDCTYRELIPQLYRLVPNKVKKKVPCRTKQQSVTVHCSGFAVIVLEMQEARLNEGIEHQVQTNRENYESLMASALKDCSINLCSAAVTLQQMIKILQSQVSCNPATAELGVELFYKILSSLNEETSAFPPTKTLFACCLERLGQSHISGVEYEMPRLLKKILSESELGGYLAPHFSPSKVGTSNLLLMYSTICKEVGKKYDVSFTLLSKFEIELWLQSKQPNLAQRNQFINLVMAALALLGFDPPAESLSLHNLFRKHLLAAFRYQFPEHHIEVLMLLLKSSTGNPETNLISITVWMDILNTLAPTQSFDLKAPLRDQCRYFAQNQKLLQHQQLLETAKLLATHFTRERLQYGLYGLYPKCRNYVDVFVLFLGLIGHGIISSMFSVHQDLSPEKLCEKVWPQIQEIFMPWIVPYSMQNLKDNMASWIQQLADDRSVLLPWINADGSFALKVLNAFKECIFFIMYTVPASTCILSYLWQWYVTCYAHASVKDHILQPIHQTFSTFPWHNFWPSVTDVEFMLRVVDQYLPECHSFLGHIFISIPWPAWLNNFEHASPQVKSRVYQCFINLCVKLSNEPNVRKNHAEKAKALLVQAENFDWSILETTFYQHVMDWFVMSCDPYVVFKNDPLDLDYKVLHFLKTVSTYTHPGSKPPNYLDKRLIYLKTYIKLLTVFTNRNKTAVIRKAPEITSLILRQLNDIENTATTEEEMAALLTEMSVVLNIDDVSPAAVKAYAKWVENKPGDGIVIRSLLKTLGVIVKNYGNLVEILETVMQNYFNHMVTNEFCPTWKEASELMNVVSAKQVELEQVMLTKGCILTLNVLFIQRTSKCIERASLLNLCLDWMVNIKITESVEPKMPLLWSNFLLLIIQYVEKDETVCAVILQRFIQTLIETAEDKGGSKWGKSLLNAIGLSKQGSLSIWFRFLCRALAGYLMAQLPDMRGVAQVIRKRANAPAKVGQAGGNTECVKLLMSLDFGHSQGKIKECAELALKQIQDPGNSLHNVNDFLALLVKQFYSKSYLIDIR